MEFKSDSVSADLFYDRIAVFPGMSVDRMRDITEMSPRFCGRKSEVDAFLCYADDFSALSETVPSLNIREASEK